jgi:hypothetical protein
MANKNTHPTAAAAPVAPHFGGDPAIVGQETRVLMLGPDVARFDFHTYPATPEGAVTLDAAAIGGYCFVLRAGVDVSEVWKFEGTPGQNTGWVQMGTGGGGGGAVSSVFTRTGAVAAALGDYLASQVENDSSVGGATVAAALDLLATAVSAKAPVITTDPGIKNAAASPVAVIANRRYRTDGSQNVTYLFPANPSDGQIEIVTYEILLGFGGVTTIDFNGKLLFGVYPVVPINVVTAHQLIAALVFCFDADAGYWQVQSSPLEFEMSSAQPSSIYIIDDNGNAFFTQVAPGAIVGQLLSSNYVKGSAFLPEFNLPWADTSADDVTDTPLGLNRTTLYTADGTGTGDLQTPLLPIPDNSEFAVKQLPSSTASIEIVAMDGYTIEDDDGNLVSSFVIPYDATNPTRRWKSNGSNKWLRVDKPEAAASDTRPWTSLVQLYAGDSGATLAFGTLTVLNLVSGDVDMFLPSIVNDAVPIGKQVFVNVQPAAPPNRGIVRRAGNDFLLNGGLNLGTELVWVDATYSFTCAGVVAPGVGVWLVQQMSGERSDEQIIVTGICASSPLPSFSVTGTGPDRTFTADADGQLVVDGTALGQTQTAHGSIFLFGQVDGSHNGLMSILSGGGPTSRFVLRQHPFMNRYGQSVGGKVVVVHWVGHAEHGSIFAASTGVSDPTNDMLWTRAGGAASGIAAHNADAAAHDTVGLAAEPTPTSGMLLRIHDAITGIAKKMTLAVLNAFLDHGTLAGLGDDDHTIYPLADGTRGFSGPVVVGTPVLGPHATNKDYVDSVVQGVEWQDSVLDRDLTVPPVVIADRYLVPAVGATGAWAAQGNKIADGRTGAWVFTTPTIGMTVAVDDELRSVRWSGSAWTFLESFLSHQALVGAGTNTHAQIDTHLGITAGNPHGTSANQVPFAANGDITSTDVQSAIVEVRDDTDVKVGLRQLTSQKDQASGYAGLDGSSKLNGAQQKYGTSANTAVEGNDARVVGAMTHPQVMARSFILC